jgi:hypothetical protein
MKFEIHWHINCNQPSSVCEPVPPRGFYAGASLEPAASPESGSASSLVLSPAVGDGRVAVRDGTRKPVVTRVPIRPRSSLRSFSDLFAPRGPIVTSIFLPSTGDQPSFGSTQTLA